MAGTILNNTYTSQVTLTNPITTIAAAGVVDVNNDGGVYGPSGTQWTVTNYGEVTATGTVGGGLSKSLTAGIVLQAGDVTNEAHALVQGGLAGVLIHNSLATVVNYGTIEGTGGAYYVCGINVEGGYVVNRAGGLITGVIGIAGGTTIINAGRVSGNSVGISGSTVTNLASGTIAGANGVVGDLFVPGAVVNSGVIIGYGQTPGISSYGVHLTAGGQVSNAAGGLIEGYENGVAIRGGLGTIVNYGTLESSGTVTTTSSNGQSAYFAAAALAGGGSLINGSRGSTGALIESREIGLYGGTETTPGVLTTVTNWGTIEVLGAAAPAQPAVELASGGTVTNYGLILSQGSRAAVAFRSTGAVAVNSGTIDNAGAGNGVYFRDGGSLTNADGGQISGGSAGVELVGAGGTVVNYGTISGAGGTAIDLGASSSTLTIEPGSSLVGSMAGFTAGDTIDFAHETGDSVSFSNGVLSLMDGSATVGTIALTGAFSADEFTLQSDNAGGTDVTLPSAPSSGDALTGDGLSDVLMTEPGGAVVLDEMSGGAMGYSQIASVGPEWQFEGDGPLTPAGKNEFVLWYDSSDNPNVSGVIALGEDNNGTATFFGVGGVGPEWQFEGVGAIEGGSNADLLLWDGSSASPDYGALVVGAVTGSQQQHIDWTQIGGVGPEWQFEGIGDFLDNGSTDFLIWDTSSSSPGYGSVVAGQDVGGTAQYTLIGGLDPTAWQFEGSGDLLDDGQDSVLIRNADTGALVVGENVGGALHYTQIGGVGPEWQFLGVGDYDGKSPAEFLMWDAGGTNPSGALVVGTVSSTAGGASVTYTQVGGVGPGQWTFQPTRPALLS